MAVFTLQKGKYFPARFYVPESGKVFIDLEAERLIAVGFVPEDRIEDFKKGVVGNYVIPIGATSDLKKVFELPWPKRSFFYLVMQNLPDSPDTAVFFRVNNVT